MELSLCSSGISLPNAVLSRISSGSSRAVWLSEPPVRICDLRFIKPEEVLGINIARGSNPTSYIDGWLIEGKKEGIGLLVGNDGQMDRGLEGLAGCLGSKEVELLVDHLEAAQIKLGPLLSKGIGTDEPCGIDCGSKSGRGCCYCSGSRLRCPFS